MASDTQRVRAHTHQGCRSVSIVRSDRSIRFPRLTASVGRYGANKAEDAGAVQKALNEVPAVLGGPLPALAVDGDAKKLTIAAIEKFQLFHFPEKYAAAKPDGRIDVDQWTLSRLKDMYELCSKLGLTVIPFWLVRRPVRLLRARLGFAQAASAIGEAISRLGDALRPLRDGAVHNEHDKQALILARLYFRLSGITAGTAITGLLQAQAALLKTQTTLDRLGRTLGLPTGGDIFEIDPKNESYLAYSPRRTSVHPVGVSPEHIYLCQASDSISTDFFNHMMVHEMMHFADEETPATEIEDKGYRADALTLSHADTLRNADSYALFATHCHIGRDRLVASQPTLAPHIPADIA